MTAPESTETPIKPTADAAAAPATSENTAAAGSTTPPAPAPTAEEQLAAAKKEAADNYDRYLRTVADLENLRRRHLREKDELRQFASGRVLEDLLPALDNLGFALIAAKAPNADLKNLLSGLTMVQDQLKNTLAGHGLKEIGPLGQPFDPNLHESLSAQPDAKVPENSVLNVVRTGYSLNGRLLRPAAVIVSSGPAKDAPPVI